VEDQLASRVLQAEVKPGFMLKLEAFHQLKVVIHRFPVEQLSQLD